MPLYSNQLVKFVSPKLPAQMWRTMRYLPLFSLTTKALCFHAVVMIPDHGKYRLA